MNISKVLSYRFFIDVIVNKVAFTQVSSRINKKQEDVSGRIIMWDYHSEAITEVLGGNIKWRYL